MVYGGLANRLFQVRIQQGRQNVVAVLTGAGGQWVPDGGGEGGQHIGQADRLAALRAGLDPAGPATEERNAVATFVDIRFLPAPRAVRVMVELLDLSDRPV